MLERLNHLSYLGLRDLLLTIMHIIRHNDEKLDNFMEEALVVMTREDMSADELTAYVLKTGEFGVTAMALLDAANTSTYGNPEITTVNLGTRN